MLAIAVMHRRGSPASGLPQGARRVIRVYAHQTRGQGFAVAHPTQAGSAVARSERRQAPDQVGLDVSDVFQAHRDADQAVADARRLAFLRSQATV